MSTSHSIAIITGGDSLEAASALRSGQRIYDLLAGGDVRRHLIAVDHWQWRLLAADGIDPAQLAEARIDVQDFSVKLNGECIRFDGAFIAIHGAPAETGQLQGYLEMAGIPYTGSGVLTSALAMDKQACKRFLTGVPGLAQPAHRKFAASAVDLVPVVESSLGYPCVIKPNAYGSGFGVALVANRTALTAAAADIAALNQGILAEQFVAGREFTVGALVMGGNIQVLPIAEVFRPDWQSPLAETGLVRFTDRQSAMVELAPDLDEVTRSRFHDLTAAIGIALGCRSGYRVDYILAEDGAIHFLELNTIPGMTATSVFTRQIQASGLDEAEVYRRLLRDVIGGSQPGTGERNDPAMAGSPNKSNGSGV